MNVVMLSLGAVVVVAVMILIFKDKAISTGHAIALGVGAALVALPSVSEFEWSEGKIKYVTRDTAGDLTLTVRSVSEQQKELQTSIAQLGDALKNTSERIAALEKIVQKQQPDAKLPTESPVDAKVFQDLMLRNDEFRRQLDHTIQTLDKVQRDLIAPTH
jgi:predicted Zn-dependent protease